MGKITVIRWGKSSLSLKKFGKSKSIIVSDTVGNMLDRHRAFFQQLFCLINAVLRKIFLWCITGGVLK